MLEASLPFDKPQLSQMSDGDVASPLNPAKATEGGCSRSQANF